MKGGFGDAGMRKAGLGLRESPSAGGSGQAPVSQPFSGIKSTGGRKAVRSGFSCIKENPGAIAI
jgi:hypothetical protein